MKLILAVFLLCATTVFVGATEVQQCGGANTPDLNEKVTISNCSKKYCRLRKGTKATVEIKFTPKEEIKTLVTSVNANIVNIPFPFIGVDGTDACPNVYMADGTTRANCPLKQGQEYVYRNSFDVLEIYPRIKVVVHWGLTANNAYDVICFEVPARITN